MTLAEGAVPYTYFRHAGIEFICLLSGIARYRHDERSYLMESGDAQIFDVVAWRGPEELIEYRCAIHHYLSASMRANSEVRATV
jgi:hypothetical protein